MPPPSTNSRSSETRDFIPEVGAEPFPGHKLIQLRGKGAFATVWEVQTPSGEKVAMKFMSSATGATATTTARELRSLQAIQSIDHPNLLKIRNVYSIPGNIVISMDLADASLLDLFTLYAEEFGKPIEATKIWYYMAQIARGLDFLNARRHRIDGKLVSLQHGDIKPNNILLVGDSARLADYGLATPLAGPLGMCPRHGTAEYCAPEVFQGCLSERSDQFSFAVTYMVLRFGAFPFPPPPSDQTSFKNYIRPEANLIAVSAAERPAMLKALSSIPQNRYPTCVDFMNAVLAANEHRMRIDQTGKVRIYHSSEDSAEIKARLFR